MRELKQDYSRDGFCVARGFLSADEVEEIRETFMAAACDGPVEGLSEFQHHNTPYEPSDPLARYPRMMHPHLRPDLAVGPLTMKYMLNPKLGPLLRGNNALHRGQTR